MSRGGGLGGRNVSVRMVAVVRRSDGLQASGSSLTPGEHGGGHACV